MDIADLANAAEEFRRTLEQKKSDNRSPDFDWYPYGSFSVFPVLQQLLTGPRRDLLHLAEPGSVLDIGCGDGDLSFFFESRGCRVLAMDHSGPNYNRVRGFRTLHRALDSRVEFREQDLDSGLSLGGRTFGLALCLGVLYHLKNPFAALESLARHARYCLLSTRIAQRTPRGAAISDEPVAYLLDPLEANNDPTNYWIFSEAGLRRILSRAGWDVCDYLTTGCRHGSDPSAPDRDQRAFCLLASKLPDPWLDCDLEGGWHSMEEGRWRWTGRVFAARLPAPGSPSPILRFRFHLPAAAVEKSGSVRLRAVIGAASLPVREYASAGEHVYEQPVPPEEVRGPSVPVRFELDKTFQPADDCRELGVQVVFWRNEGATAEALRPITVA